MSQSPVDCPELARDVRDGSPEAWRLILSHWNPPILAVIRRHGHGLQPADVEDILQNTWHRAYEGRESIIKPECGMVLPLLLRIARGRTIDLRRRKRSHAALPADDLVPDDGPRAAALDANQKPEQIAMTTETIAVIGSCMDTLPAKERDILVRRGQSDLPLSDIAGEMGMSDGAAKALLYRARRRLRELLDAAGFDDM